jgi:hypothetical protein
MKNLTKSLMEKLFCKTAARKKNILIYSLIIFLVGCNYITATPHSKRKQHLESPSILLFDKIVDFRIEQGGWPTSKQDFESRGTKYYEVFNGFKYQTTEFKRIDSNTMIFYFSNHVKDYDRYQASRKVDINSYNGQVKFYKENNKFLWKLKMN